MLLTQTGTLNPGLALSVTGVVGSAGVLVGRLEAWDRRAAVWAGVTVGMTAVTVLLARTFHLTRLTPDSIRYLLFSADLRLPDALREIHPADFLLRQMGLPSLHAPSALTDRRYLASIGPLFGVSGLGFFVWSIWHYTRELLPRPRWSVVAAAAIFLGTSNRLVYDAFYINTHIEVSVYLLIAIAGSWLAVAEGRWVGPCPPVWRWG